MELTVYGGITTKFKIIAQLVKLCKRIKNKELNETSSRLDCHDFKSNVYDGVYSELEKKFTFLKLKMFINSEIFYPTQNYPPHTDEGGISYFIPLEEGTFQINGINYPVIPFILYSFEDSNPHNSNFVSIMLK
jgi:hypothetical protein